MQLAARGDRHKRVRRVLRRVLVGRSSEVTNVKDDARFATSTDRDTRTPPDRTPELVAGVRRREVPAPKITAASRPPTRYGVPPSRDTRVVVEALDHVTPRRHIHTCQNRRAASARPPQPRAPRARGGCGPTPRHPRQRNKAKHNQSIIEWPINGHVPGCNATHRIATHEIHDGPRRRAHTDTHAVRNTQRQDARSLDRVMTSPRGALNATALPWHTVPRRHPAPHTLTRVRAAIARV